MDFDDVNKKSLVALFVHVMVWDFFRDVLLCQDFDAVLRFPLPRNQAPTPTLFDQLLAV
jgi:hypothetical protein